MDTKPRSTGPGTPDEAPSRASTNSPNRRTFSLAGLIDAHMAAYATPARGLATRLAFWKTALGHRNAAEITVDDVDERHDSG